MFSRSRGGYHQQSSTHEPLEQQLVVPHNFICPLTLEIMTDPVMDHDGHNFERTAILEWLTETGEDDGICPISCKPMRVQDISPDDTLKARIQQWVAKHQRQRINRHRWDDENVSTVDSQSQSSITADDSKTRNKNDVCPMKAGSCTNEILAATIADSNTITSSPLSPGLPPPKVIHNNTCKAHTAYAMHSMLLPQELHAMELFRERSRERRVKQRRAFVVKTSVGISLSLLSLLIVLVIVKYINDYFKRQEHS